MRRFVMSRNELYLMNVIISIFLLAFETTVSEQSEVHYLIKRRRRLNFWQDFICHLITYSCYRTQGQNSIAFRIYELPC